MAVKNIEARIMHKRDTNTNWTNNNPVLLNGEIIIVDMADGSSRTKIGNGSKYNNTPFDDEATQNAIEELRDNMNFEIVSGQDDIIFVAATN